MNKDKLRQLIEQNTENYKLLVSHEITVYASKPESGKRVYNGMRKPVNLRQEEWEEYLRQVEAGTYVPETDVQYQERPRPKKKSTVVYSTEEHDPMWRLK